MENEFPRIELDLGHVGNCKSFSLTEDFVVPGPEENSRLKCMARVEAEVTRNGDRFLVEGKIRCDIRAYCDRCLEPFDYKADTEFIVMLQKGGGSDIPEGMDSEDYAVLAEGEEYRYDIFPRVREAVLLELPIRYLCRDECAGICAGCGNNLNLSECTCEDRGKEDVWEPLKKLLKDREDK